MRTLCRLIILPLLYICISLPACILRFIWVGWQFGWEEGDRFFSWIIGPDPRGPHT